MPSNQAVDFPAEIEKVRSTRQGTNLAMVKELAERSGPGLQAAKRAPGSAIVTPSVVHWRLDHFGALVSAKNGHYVLKDPTFDNASYLSISQKAIDSQSDGYFLIPATEKLPAGWTAVSDEEAKNVWGKGESSKVDPNAKTVATEKTCISSIECGCKGMRCFCLHSGCYSQYCRHPAQLSTTSGTWHGFQV
ncbi:MAG: hypothetical protein IPM93_27385 [Candidatus Obscuribacter sp.]|nr:hypothetical protein [Candidatus Obscuribacter sp.]